MMLYSMNNFVTVFALCTGWAVRRWMRQWFRSMLACTPYLGLCTNRILEATSSPGYWLITWQANLDSKEVFVVLVQYKGGPHKLNLSLKSYNMNLFSMALT